MVRIHSSPEFKDWELTIPERIDYLLETVPQLIRDQLDYSPESLDILEQWILERYETLKLPVAPADARLFDAAATYVGEMFRKHVGGQWMIELRDKQHGYLGIPGIDDFKEGCIPIHPHTWVTASVDRRTGHFIRTRFEKSSGQASA